MLPSMSSNAEDEKQSIITSYKATEYFVCCISTTVGVPGKKMILYPNNNMINCTYYLKARFDSACCREDWLTVEETNLFGESHNSFWRSAESWDESHMFYPQHTIK